MSFRPKTTLRNREEKVNNTCAFGESSPGDEIGDVRSSCCTVGLGLATIWTRSHSTNH